MSTGRVQDKVALITGAARGQGRSHAVRLAEEGADIIGIDICQDIETVPYPGPNADDLEETRILVEKTGQRMRTYIADVRDGEALSAAVAEGVGAFGHLDIVCANAGILSLGESENLTPVQWSTMIDTNLTGVWNTTTAAIPIMKRQGTGGCIILTSSFAGLRAYAGVSHYVAAKHGVVGLMRALALELAPHWIRVNSIHPSNVRTAMIENDPTYRIMRPDLENPTLEDASAAFGAMNLLPAPWMESIDISNAVLWLASDEARCVTGVALPVDLGANVK